MPAFSLLNIFTDLNWQNVLLPVQNKAYRYPIAARSQYVLTSSNCCFSARAFSQADQYSSASNPFPLRESRLCCFELCQFGVNFEPRDIFSIFKLVGWAITLSLETGCFQAYFPSVSARRFLFPLKFNLETLLDNLGCFPLDIGP